MTSPHVPRKAPTNGDEVRRLHTVEPSVATVDVAYLANHLSWMRRAGRAERTIQCRRREMERLARSLGHDPVTATLLELEAWQSALPTMNTMRWTTAIIRPYYRYLRDRGIRPDDPAALLPIPRQPVHLPRPISEDQLALAIASAPRRLLPWLLLAGWCGLRAVEIAGVHRESFSLDADGQTWLLVVGKGSKERYVPVPEWVWARIEPGLPAAGPCWGLLYTPDKPLTARHVSQYTATYLHSIGLSETLHTFRHRVATEVLHQTGDLRLVQDLLGHANLAQLQIYTKVRAPQMGRAVNNLPQPPATGPTDEA